MQTNYGVAAGGDDAETLPLRTRSNTIRLAANKAVPMIKAAYFRRLQVGSFAAASAETFSVRFIPSGVASNAQEI